MKKNSIFHAGPPIEWKRMCGPLKGAIVGTMIYEGLASNWSGAVKLIENGEIEFSPNHDHDAVGPMAGVISSSLPVLVVKNKKYGNIWFFNPGFLGGYHGIKEMMQTKSNKFFMLFNKSTMMGSFSEIRFNLEFLIRMLFKL